MFARSRCRAGTAALAAITLAAAALVGVVLNVPAAAAATTTTAKCKTPDILAGISATGATVATPGEKVRTLNKDQATAFMQTWIAYSVFENPPQERPPAGVPISQLEVATLQSGQSVPFTIFYATDGTTVWVGAPAPVKAPPPNDQKWIRVPKPDETTAAFEGNLAPICTDPASATSTAPGSTTTAVQAVKPADKSSDDGTPWALIIVGLLVVVGGGSVLVFRSRRRPASLSS